MAEAELANHFHKILNTGPSVSSSPSSPSSSKMTIQVDPNSDKPVMAWEKISRKQKLKIKRPMDLYSEQKADCVRFVCISDTHRKFEKSREALVPFGDVLLHAGDFTMHGSLEEILEFNTFLGGLPHQHKIVIAGNHDMTLDDEHTKNLSDLSIQEKKILKSIGVKHPRELLTNCLYLQDSGVQVAGITIYGSPWTPLHGCYGFARKRGQRLLDKWNLIPEDTDILMTHGPPVGFGDTGHRGVHAGCVDLLNTVQQRVKPVYHVYGHIHEGYGMVTDGTTTFINASVCNSRYKPLNPPIVFDVPLPQGRTKEDPIIMLPT